MCYAWRRLLYRLIWDDDTLETMYTYNCILTNRYFLVGILDWEVKLFHITTPLYTYNNHLQIGTLFAIFGKITAKLLKNLALQIFHSDWQHTYGSIHWLSDRSIDKYSRSRIESTVYFVSNIHSLIVVILAPFSSFARGVLKGFVQYLITVSVYSILFLL